MLLSRYEYSVTIFTNSQDLLHAVSLVKPDVILLDVLLAEVNDGKSVCTKLRHQYQYGNKIYLFSVSSVSQADVQKCGADSFIEKPFDIHSFMKIINQAITPSNNK